MERKNDIMHLIKKINFQMRTAMDARLRENDLTFTQMIVLRYISQNGGTAGQKEIQEYLNVSHPTVVGLVKRLESHGFVECRADEQDRRSKLVTLTPSAREFGRSMEEGKKKADEAVLGSFSEEELAEFTRLLNKLYDSINRQEVTEDD